MKTILLAIVHYGSSNRQHFLRCLKEYNSFENYSITAHLFLTEDIDCSEFSKLSIEKHICPASLGENLSQEFKPIFYENRGKFDYYIYYEDDVLMTKEAFDTFVSIQDNLTLPYVCGFLRYELKEGEDYKYLIDSHPKHSCHRGGTTIIKSNHIINGEPYFEVYNVHHGDIFLQKKH